MSDGSGLPPTQRIRLRLRDIKKGFGERPAVDGVTLEVPDGEFLVLLGPSGCGKTTLLRMIAGFTKPDGGTIELDGEEIANATSIRPPEQRNMAMVFQSYALWPNKSIFDNVAFGLKIRKRPKSEIEDRVGEALRLVKMEGYQRRYPSQLSGGEQQRIALARALIVRPAVFLFDEPLSNLDASLREDLRFELKELQTKLGITSIYVTHDQAEAMVMADRVAVMYKGRIQQLATPGDIYNRPATTFVSAFIGQTNLLRAKVSADYVNGALIEVQTDAGLSLQVPASGIPFHEVNRDIGVSVRPENISLTRIAVEGRVNQFPGVIVQKFIMGGHIDYRVAVGSHVLRVQTHPDHNYEIGEAVFVHIESSRCHCMTDAVVDMQAPVPS